MRTKHSDASSGSSVSSQMMWSDEPERGRSPPAPIHTVSTPQASPRRMASTIWGSSLSARATTMSPGRTLARRVATTSAPMGTVTAASARLPTITGWTNSTATWEAWNGQLGEVHHMVAPELKRRARASEARPMSSATAAISVIRWPILRRPRTYAPASRARPTSRWWGWG